MQTQVLFWLGNARLASRIVAREWTGVINQFAPIFVLDILKGQDSYGILVDDPAKSLALDDHIHDTHIVTGSNGEMTSSWGRHRVY